MKRKLLLFFSLSFITLFSQSYNPHHNNLSELNVRLFDGAVFNITIDNRSYNNFQTNYTLSNLTPGRHFVKIVRFEEYFNGHSYTYVRPRIIFSGRINIAARSKINAYLNHRNRYVVESQFPIHQVPPGHGPGYGGGYGPGHGDYYHDVMSPQAFSHLRRTIANASFDSSKLSIAKQAIRMNRVTSRQVYDIMMLLSFESKRLELAKFAYANTVDKGSYYIVNEAFSFSSSIRELNEYLAYAF